MKLDNGQRVGYFRWLLAQLRGWSVQSYLLLAFGIGFNLAVLILGGQFDATNITSFLAGIIGLTCTLAIANAKPINGILGLISALMFIAVAFPAKNYMEIVMQLSYIVLLDIPVMIMPSWANNVEKKIRGLWNKKTGLHNYAWTALFFAAAWLVMYIIDVQLTDSPRPVIDALSAAIGLTGAILCTLRFREQYFLWTAQGLASMVLWGITAAQGGANWILFTTYALYLANDVIGFTVSPWFKKAKTGKDAAVQTAEP